MAPASAGSQPPPEQPDAGQGTERDRWEGTPEGAEPDQEETREEHEIYGPLDLQRETKDDGRALILYTRRGHPRQGREGA